MDQKIWLERDTCVRRIERRWRKAKCQWVTRWKRKAATASSSARIPPGSNQQDGLLFPSVAYDNTKSFTRLLSCHGVSTVTELALRQNSFFDFFSVPMVHEDLKDSTQLMRHIVLPLLGGSRSFNFTNPKKNT